MGFPEKCINTGFVHCGMGNDHGVMGLWLLEYLKGWYSEKASKYPPRNQV